MKKWKPQFKKAKKVALWLYPRMKNKYIITILVFFVWMLFFDRNDLISRYKLKRQLSKLKTEKEFYLKEISKVEETNTLLFYSDETLEKYAREKYLMKRDDEEIFLIVEKK
ncbi:MAG: septum formation initiator family protein [Chitinophagales bacterium]|nr:septum formation initiator family protein [Chitinophagales bacterium]